MLLYAGFFAGATGAIGQLRVTEKNQWDVEIKNNKNWLPDHTKSKEPTEQSLTYSKIMPGVDVFVGAEKFFGAYHFWSTSIGGGYINPQIKEKESDAVILNISPVQDLDNAVVKKTIPMRGNSANPDIHATKIDNFFVNARSILGVAIKSYYLGVGVSSIACPIEQDFYVEKPEKNSFGQEPFKKWVFGGGPCITVKYDVSPQIRFVCYGEALFFKSLEREKFDISSNKGVIEVKESVAFKIKPFVWRVALGMEFYSSRAENLNTKREIAQKIKYYKFVCKKRKFKFPLPHCTTKGISRNDHGLSSRKESKTKCGDPDRLLLRTASFSQ